MQEPHGESLANYADLESCAGGREIAGEALTEALAGRLLSREIPLFGCRPCVQKGRPYQPSRFRKRRKNPARSENPCTSGNSPRENRETSEAPAAKWQAGGGRRKPHAPRVHRRGVGPGRSTSEGSEQGRATVGGGSGGKGRDRGERRRVRHGPHTEADRPCPKRWTACGAEAVVGLALTPLSEVRAV